MHFNSLTQNGQESIQEFAVRLQSTAAEYEFTCPNYQHDLSPFSINKDRFICGLTNNTLLTDFLAKANLMQILESIITHAISFWNNCLRPAQTTRYPPESSTEHIKSFQQSSKSNIQTNDLIRLWSFTHRLPRSNHRSSQCQAWGRNCNNCGIANHFASVCQKPTKQPKVNNIDLTAHLQYHKSNNIYVLHPHSIQTKFQPLYKQNSMSNPNCNLPKCLFFQTVVLHLPWQPPTFKANGNYKHLQPCRKKTSAVGGSFFPCQW